MSDLLPTAAAVALRPKRTGSGCSPSTGRGEPGAGNDLHTEGAAHAAAQLHSPHPSDRETQEHPQVPVCWRIPPEISARLSLEAAALSLRMYENISTRAHPRVLPSSSSREDAQFALIPLQVLRGTLERSFRDLVFTICCFSLKIPIWIEIICMRSQVRNILVSLLVSGVLHF